MPKCDNAETDKTLLLDDGTREGWCRACYTDLLRADFEEPGTRCEQCRVIHLSSRTIEKLTGWLCRDCAKAYEAELLAKMTA